MAVLFWGGFQLTLYALKFSGSRFFRIVRWALLTRQRELLLDRGEDLLGRRRLALATLEEGFERADVGLAECGGDGGGGGRGDRAADDRADAGDEFEQARNDGPAGHGRAGAGHHAGDQAAQNAFRQREPERRRDARDHAD